MAAEIMGHGVLFYFKKPEFEERIPIAFLDKYDWLHGNPESVDVLLFDVDPKLISKTGLSLEEIVREVLDFVNEFVNCKGKISER